VRVVDDLISARLDDFELLDDSEHTAALQSWIGGYLTWTGRTGRYRPPAPLKFTFHRPSGLGTAAVFVRQHVDAQQDWQDAQ
jgi:hypothetical protein